MKLYHYFLGRLSIKRGDYAIYFMLAIYFFLLSIPLLHAGICCGDDRWYHLARIQSLSDALKLHQFPIKIHETMANSYGYGTGFFYADFFLYIPAALIAFLGVDLTMAYKIFMLLFLLFFIIATYLSSKFILKDKYIALIPTLLITVSHYAFLTFYQRFALGEMLGFVFLILMFAGMYDIIFEEYKHSWLVILSGCGAILSHLMTTVFILLFCVLMVLLNARNTFTRKKIKKAICHIFLIILLTAFFWIPMVEQMLTQSLEYQLPWTLAEKNTYAWKNLLGDDKYTLGILIIGIAILCVILQIRLKRMNKLAMQYLVLGIVITFLTGLEQFWRISDKIVNIQFPWRLFGLVTVLISMSFGLLLQDIVQKRKLGKKVIGLYLFVLLILSVVFTNQQIYKTLETDEDKTLDIKGVNVLNKDGSLGGGHEYLPISMTLGDLVHPMQAEDEDGNFIGGVKNNLIFMFKAQRKKNYQVPFVYYKGYHAKVVTNKGQEISLKVTLGKNGFVSITVPQNGTVIVWYESTILTKISYGISGMAFFFLLIASAYKWNEVTHNKKANKYFDKDKIREEITDTCYNQKQT